MSGIAIAFAVVGWALFGVTLLSVVCDWAGLGRWSGRGAVDHDRPVNEGVDFDRSLEARRQPGNR
jgi:hypothetical protein